MSGLRIFWSQTRHHFVASTRDGQMIAFNLILPLVIFGFFTAIFGEDVQTTIPRVGSIAFNPYYAAGLMAYAVAQGTFGALVISLTNLRETGTLKRLRGTPLPMWAFILARFVIALLFVALGVLALGVLAWAAFDVSFRLETAPGLAVYLVLGTFTFTCLSFALASFTTTVPSATAVATAIVMVLSFISGVFLASDVLPAWIITVAQFFPLEPLANGLQSTFAPQVSGPGLDGRNVALLLAWGVAGLTVALTSFRWEPRDRRG